MSTPAKQRRATTKADVDTMKWVMALNVNGLDVGASLDF